MGDITRKANILIVDDEEDICEILQYNLEKADYGVKTVLSSEEALSVLSSEKYDLLLLDIMLGGISGLRLAKLLREDYKNNIPIIFITALDTEEDVLKGFNIGCDDYISKPFSVNQVVARVGAVLARSSKSKQKEDSAVAPEWRNVGIKENVTTQAEVPTQSADRFDFGCLVIEVSTNQVFVENEEVYLTKKEMEILLLLAKGAGKLFSREEILKCVWKGDTLVLQVEKDAGYYSGGNFDGIEKAMLYNQRMNEVRRGVNTDWLARPLRNAYNWRNDISLSGGVESVRYMLNLNYDNNSGVMKGSKRNRYGAGMTVDYRLKNWLQIQNKVSLDRTNYQDSPYGYFNDYSNQLPYDAIYDERGEYLKILPMSHRSNPLWQEQNLQSYFGRGGITDITDNFLINIHFTQNFYLRGTFSVSQVKTDSKTFRDPKDESFRTLANNRKGSLSTSGDTRLKWNANALLHFNQRFGKHFVNLTGGIDAQETKDNRVSYVQEGFNIGSLSDPIYAAQQPDKTVDTKSTTRLFGFLSSLNYTFDEVYLLDASFRLDGSSQFGKDKRFAPFASIGLGLNIHNYKFMKELPWINTLRVRGTYGSTGKVNFSRFDVISSYIVDSNSWYYTGPAVKLYTMGNPRLTWETTKTLDFGLMAEFFKNRLYLEANYYRKTTDGMIDKIAIRPSSGFTSYNGNVGSIINRGFELKTNVTLFRNKDWSVVANANLASNKNKISKLDEAIEEYNKKIRENYDAENPQYANLQNRPLIQYYVGASTTSIYAVPSLGIDPASGKEMFLKKDGTITKEWNANDMVVCGNTSPDAQGSFGFNVAYKGLYVNASFLYAFGGQQYNQTLLDKVENANIENGNVDRRVLTDRWRKVGDVSPFYGLIERGSTKPTSRFVQNENYVYFNSIAIGYNFGRKFVSMLKLSALSVSFNASDLARWSTIKQERGLSYPYAHTYSISLRASY